MGHKWSQNVIDWGLMDLGISLASPGAVVNPNYILTNQPGTSTYAWLWFRPVPERPDDFYTRVTIAKNSPHFPYGWPVDPDEPV